MPWDMTDRQCGMPTITDDRMTLIELVEKQAEGDFVREMLAFATDRIVEAEVEERSFAGAWGSRSLHGRAEMSIEFCNNYRQKIRIKPPICREYPFFTLQLLTNLTSTLSNASDLLGRRNRENSFAERHKRLCGSFTLNVAGRKRAVVPILTRWPAWLATWPGAVPANQPDRFNRGNAGQPTVRFTGVSESQVIGPGAEAAEGQSIEFFRPFSLVPESGADLRKPWPQGAR